MGTADQWIQHTRHTLQRFDEALLRQVAHKLCKPRNQWPVDELLDRVTAALNNAAMIDRRLKELPAACRQMLVVMERGRQTRWSVGTLVEILVTLGHDDGLAPLVTLLESGLLLPELFPLGSDPEQDKGSKTRFKNIATWLARSEPMPIVLASPMVTGRASEELKITCPEAEVPAKATVHEADGLDWPLRVAVLWQHALAAPLRRTQQGDFFKRDADRLGGDPLLSVAPTDVLAPIPDPGFFTAALAAACGLLREDGAELHAGSWPAGFRGALPGLIAELWIALSRITSWNPAAGHGIAEGTGNPYPSAYLLALLLLGEMPEKAWVAPQAVEDWIAGKHPFWLGKTSESIGINAFLLGIAYSLRLLQAAKDSADKWCVRLSPLGRWLIGASDKQPALSGFKQTLLVQPNLEILAYRQGLTPELITSLSKFATWRGLGPACTLQLEPHSVYRALEMEESLTSILQTLESHGMKTVPAAVLDSLRTWSSKRERISVYSAGAIFEFASPAEMTEAIARGLPAVRLTDRLAIVADEGQIDFKHFRLTSTRDYTLAAEKCVDVEADGVTLNVDLARSDLLLETELLRFAESIAAPTPVGRQQYRITPTSIQTARQHGLTLAFLESWFGQRTGLPISAAAQLLLTGRDSPGIELRRRLVLQVANEHLADGLAQWPGTRSLVVARLGPTSLVIDEKDVPAFTERMKELGIKMLFEM